MITIIKNGTAPEHDGSKSSVKIVHKSATVVAFPSGKAQGHHAPRGPDIKKKKKLKGKNKTSKPNKGLKRGRPRTHGLSGTPTYKSWASARDRCNNPNHLQSKDYGGRGIECRISVEELVEAIGLRPDGTTLDRINPNGHYEPGNIQWATPQQQANNRRPTGYYRGRAVQRIRDNRRDWVENARFWRLSVRGIDRGYFSDVEREELTRLAGPTNLPQTSFDIHEPMDWAHPVVGTATLPSLTRPGQPVTVQAGPCGGLSHSPHHDCGVLLSLTRAPLAYNCSERERALLREFWKRYKAGLTLGLCYTGATSAEAQSVNWNTPPEGRLMAITAYLLGNQKNARLMTMSVVSDRLAGDWTHLLTGVLVIPDFHVDGPRGFGIEPWRIEDLQKLLEIRRQKHFPTIIYADDPWALDPEIGAFINHHYTLVGPADVE